MPSPTHATNPFALMLDPQAVLASVAHSERLARLHSRICRPLDKPLLGGQPEQADTELEAELETNDAADAETETETVAQDMVACKPAVEQAAVRLAEPHLAGASGADKSKAEAAFSAWASANHSAAAAAAAAEGDRPA